MAPVCVAKRDSQLDRIFVVERTGNAKEERYRDKIEHKKRTLSYWAQSKLVFKGILIDVR